MEAESCHAMRGFLEVVVFTIHIKTNKSQNNAFETNLSSTFKVYFNLLYFSFHGFSKL
jgi:hypothetical protein